MPCFSTSEIKSAGVYRASADLQKCGLADRKLSGFVKTLVKLQRPPPEMAIFFPTRSECSSTKTRRPRLPASIAQKRPAAPAPITMTSHSRIDNLLPRPASCQLGIRRALLVVDGRQHRNSLVLSLIAQGIFQDRLGSASLSRPKANHNPAEINHIAIAKSAGALSPGKLQLDDSVCLLKPGLNRLWLFKPRVGNHCPTNLSAFQQPLHCPFVDPARTSNEPGPALIHERREMLFKQSAGRIAIHIARAKDRNRCSGGHIR